MKHYYAFKSCDKIPCKIINWFGELQSSSGLLSVELKNKHSVFLSKKYLGLYCTNFKTLSLIVILG